MTDHLPALLALSQAEPIDDADQAFLEWIGRFALQELEDIVAARRLADPPEGDPAP